MKIRILKWLWGTNEKTKQNKSETMPNFKKIFVSLPHIIKATTIPEDTKTHNVSSVQERATAKSVVEKEAKAAASKDKVDDVYARIETAKSKNLEIVWLLQTNEDVPFESLSELIENYGNIKDRDSYRGMSVCYVSNGKPYEISPLGEQDLAYLLKKLESGNKVKSEAS